jgi:metal-responsive CopG/Arc/MetJ family transcriptional regulator
MSRVVRLAHRGGWGEGRAMARPKKDETMSTISVRLPKGLISEIDRYTEKLKADTRLAGIGRSETIRYLLQMAVRRSARRRS